MFKKLITGVAITFTLVVAQMPTSDVAFAASKQEQKQKKRKTRVPGQAAGKRLAKAFEAYEKEEFARGIDILDDYEPKKPYDKASVAYFLAVLYATVGDREKEAIAKLKEAVGPDVLNTAEQGGALRTLADLQMQVDDFKGALKHYHAWMDFTGKSDAGVLSRMSQAYLTTKQYANVVKYADKAIAAYGDKQNKNPYILKLQAFYERKKYKEAVDVLEKAVQLFPEEKTFWVQLGNFYLLIEDYNRSIATLELAYKMGYLEKEAHIKTLASLYSQIDIPFKAATLLEKHIKEGLVKKNKTIIMTLANAWHAAMHVDKAAVYYGELAKITNAAKDYSKQGMLLKQDEQFKKALVAFDKALELGAKDKGRIYMSIAECHFYLEQYKKAYAAINKAMEDPKTKKSAKGWVGFIAEKAKRNGVDVKS